jgi:hypothetical protein
MANKGFVADVCINVPYSIVKWRRIGSIYWGGDDRHFAKILLSSLPMVTDQFTAFVLKGVEQPPYLEGDILAPAFGDSGREYVGFINSSQNELGKTTYSGRLISLPLAVFRKLATSPEESVWLTINLQ